MDRLELEQKIEALREKEMALVHKMANFQGPVHNEAFILMVKSKRETVREIEQLEKELKQLNSK